MSFLFLPLRVGRRARGLHGPNCPWEIRVYICATATPLCALRSVLGGCWQLAEQRAPAACQHTSAQPHSVCASFASRRVCQPSKYLLSFPILPAFWEIHTDTDSSGPSFCHLVSKFCIGAITADNQVWVPKKKNHLLVIEMYFIHTSVIPEFLCTPSLWATKMSTIARHRELWSSKIQSVLFLFLVFHPEICFSPYHPWPMQGRKGLAISFTSLSCKGQCGMHVFWSEIRATETEKWEVEHLMNLFSLVNNIWQLWEIVFKRVVIVPFELVK